MKVLVSLSEQLSSCHVMPHSSQLRQVFPTRFPRLVGLPFNTTPVFTHPLLFVSKYHKYVENVDGFIALKHLLLLSSARRGCWQCGPAGRGPDRVHSQHEQSGLHPFRLSHSHGWEQPLHHLQRRCRGAAHPCRRCPITRPNPFMCYLF